MKSIYQALLSRCLHTLAKIYLIFNYPLRAIAYLEAALQIFPRDKAVYYSLARAYQILGKWDDLIISLEKVSDIVPDDQLIHWQIGILALDIRRNEKALDHFLYCYTHTPKDDTILLARRQALLGASLILAKDWSNADKHLTEARLLVPWDLDACSATIQLYLCNKRSQDISGFVDSYISEYPTLYPFYSWKGDHFQHILRQPVRSLEFYRLALENISNKKTRVFCNGYVFTNNMFDEILDGYVEALVASGYSSIAISEAQKYENYKMGTKMASIKRRILYYALTKNFGEAENFLSSLDVKFTESTEFLSSMAFLRNKEGKFPEAIATIEKVIKSDKDYIEAYHVLGEIQISSKQWEMALATYTYLSNRDFYTAFQMKMIGLCYFHLGNLEKSIELYKECLLHDEFDAEAWIDLGDIYKNQKKAEMALSAYQNALKFDWLAIEKRQYAENSIKNLERPVAG